MLETKLTEEMVQFTSEAKSWEETIRIASAPLLDKGSIEPRYVEKIISNVKELGPYIILMPNVAMPHARPEDGVNETGISLLVSKESVYFQGEKSARIFLVLASSDATSHLELLKEISEILTDEEKLNELLAAKNYQDIKNLF
ncbi:PTS sugar transporter subunit IIA [Jeotgalibacillus proteolyticus]|uniref:Ascorbate-specific PTS system EIIA component n=1 Tax=Jeotgalibacillus proteolyticus TaxID=2082395 RepID=A0A2S5G988_9BACL|nr:PTS sugar transporter subunit IIA [Jeotgalibacillus proteolyticus]PPA69548.1 PTS sugar transporter subunit IIA [Jeotgalibacillus proteolyticus]